MQVVEHAGAGRAAQVDADVDPLWRVRLVNAISACRVSRISSVCSPAVVAERLATCRFGTIIR
jgi:hypothetical protein